MKKKKKQVEIEYLSKNSSHHRDRLERYTKIKLKEEEKHDNKPKIEIDAKDKTNLGIKINTITEIPLQRLMFC